MGLAAFNARRRAARKAAEEAAAKAETPLAEMTIPKLKEYAESKGIGLGDAKKKDEILAVIQAAEEAAAKAEGAE